MCREPNGSAAKDQATALERDLNKQEYLYRHEHRLNLCDPNSWERGSYIKHDEKL